MLNLINENDQLISRRNTFKYVQDINNSLNILSSIQFHNLNIQGETIRYPFIVINRETYSSLITSYNLDNEYFNINLFSNELLAETLKYNKVKNSLQNYLNELISINQFVETGMTLPLNIIRTKHDTNVNASHIIFGDLIQSSFEPENFDIAEELSKYVKIPKRCCQLIQPYITYERMNPLYEFIDNVDRTIQLYQHPIYKTFRVFIKGNEEDNQFKKQPLYRIIPCVGKINMYENNINTYNKLKKRCQEIKSMNIKNPIYNNSFNELQIKTKINEINENEVGLIKMRNEINKLEKELNKKDIIRKEFNRSKLQKYNDNLSATVYKGYKKLIDSKKDKINVNLLYTENILGYLKEQCKAEKYTICRTNKAIQTKIVDKIDELEKQIEADRIKAEMEKQNLRLRYERMLSDYETKQRIKELGLKDADYEKQLMDIIKLFPNKPDILFDENQSSCFGCS